MKLSLRVWLSICGFVWLASGHEVKAQSEAPLPSAVTDAWEEALERRIERVLPVLLSSLAAVRRDHDKALVRCFDRAVAGLNSVQRQVSYHADLRYEARSASERLRHEKALLLLSERVDALAMSVETCFTDGLTVKSGQTRVEMVVEGKR